MSLLAVTADPTLARLPGNEDEAVALVDAYLGPERIVDRETVEPSSA